MVGFIWKLLDSLNLETAVEREKDVQLIDVPKKSKKGDVTSLVMSSFLDFLGILRSCADFRDSTEGSRLKVSIRVN